ncbi:MAG: tRNA (N6-threonylcarbamoyladenosine(37)-N6)-methyltransferase TrmO, partial [Clostridia bacterium]|nr:tRNA (N6-threonylcarbamoyladenosine(37)-N6)-methyltransferase TrmO [Clostridia bacterium]
GFKEGAGTVAVECPPDLLEVLPADKRQGLLALLAQDPRPGYTDDPERIFGMAFGGYEIRFQVQQKTLKVLEIEQK